MRDKPQQPSMNQIFLEQHPNSVAPNMGMYAMPQQNMYMTGMQSRPVPNMGAQMNMMNMRMNQMNLSQGMMGNKPMNMGMMSQPVTGGMNVNMSGRIMGNMSSNIGMMGGQPASSAYGPSQNFSSSNYSGFKGVS